MSNEELDRDAKTQARLAAEARRAQAEQGKSTKGVPRNAPGQRAHAAEEAVHDAGHIENTDREADDIYATDGESEIFEWRRHSALDAPPARPGYVNRFIRVRLGTTRDVANWQAKHREGWRPVKASSVIDRSLPTTHHDGAEVIGVDDLILCEMPEKVFEQRMAFYRRKLQAQNAAIQRDLQKASVSNAIGFGPIEQSRRSSVSHAPPARRVANVASDD